jgi:hypothetical protein
VPPPQEFEVLSFSKTYLKAMDAFVKEKIKEFEFETMIFDHAHIIARSSAETALALLEERAMKNRGSEWKIVFPYTTIHVKNTRESHFIFTYKVGAKRSDREAVKALLAMNEYFNAEQKLNKDFEIPLKASRSEPNPSLNRSTNGAPPGPAWRYAVHFRQSGPGVPPSAPG